MKNFYNAALMLVVFFAFQISAFSQKEHGSKSSDNSKNVELAFYKNTDDPITAETVDYFVELTNNSGKPQVFQIRGEMISCDDASLESSDVKFEILDKNGAPLKLIKTSENQRVQFIVRTTKPQLNKTSWSCIQIHAKSDSSSQQNFASILIKQLNPGASNFK
ncbi:hypothetical protein [Leeuwenhoekiella sp. H156]|uniref:hypothetical protein n=1 Tax=Leeuwenhoekiella sp. H156 TaxID=3450128 RepID=UPI003FA455E9